MKQLTATEKVGVIDEVGGSQKENLIAAILELQKKSPDGYIDHETATLLAKEFHMTETKVFEVLTFYAMLKTEPQAKYRFKVCGSTPCHFTKQEFTAEVITEVTGLKPGQVSEDRLFSFEYVPCFGACDIAPAIKVNEEVHGHMTPDKFRALYFGLKSKEEN